MSDSKMMPQELTPEMIRACDDALGWPMNAHPGWPQRLWRVFYDAAPTDKPAPEPCGCKTIGDCAGMRTPGCAFHPANRIMPDASASVPDDVRFFINCLEAGQTPDDRKAAAIVASLSRELAEARAELERRK